MRSPRPYQVDAINAVRSAFTKGIRGAGIECATGLGKGLIIALIAKMVLAKGKRVLIAVNRDQLCQQLFESCVEQGLHPVMEKGMDKASPMSDLVVASIQTAQKQRLLKWNPHHFGLVITDEVHGAASKTFKATLEHFKASYHLGFSATMERHDKAALWGGFESVVYTMTYRQAVNDGWLVDFEFVELPVPIRVSDQQASQKRWGENEEMELFSTDNYLPRLFAEASRWLSNRKSLLFWPNCTSSIEATKHFQSLGFEARHIEGEGGPAKMNKKQIREILDWYAEPGEKVLSNCELLSTGFDQPDIDQVGIMRVIRSVPLIKQMVGRGTRTACVVDGLPDAEARKASIAKSKKPKLRILDLMIQMSSVEQSFADVTALITDDKAEREFIREQQRQAGRQLTIEEIESKLKAKRETDKEAALAKLAEDAANAARKSQQQRTIFVGDILAAFNPAHKPATIGARKELEWKIRHGNWIVPIGERPLSMYQIIRIQQRIEQRAQKLSRK